MSLTKRISLLPALEVKHKFFGPIEVEPLDGKIIIKVPRRRDLDKVALDVVEKYAKRLMHSLKHLIHPAVKNALEYIVAKEIVTKLDEERYPESHSLLNKFYDKTLSNVEADNVMRYVYDLEEMARRGVMEILLTVYAEMGRRMRFYIPSESILNETLRIFNHILRIGTKGRENVSLVYRGTVNYGVILLDIKSIDSFDHYFRRIQSYTNNGISMIFVLGAGFINRKAVQIIAEKFARKEDEWVMMIPSENEILSLNGQKAKSRCILLKRRPSRSCGVN